MKKINIGNVAVDSGQVVIVDPCYLSNWKDGEYEKNSNENHYSEACNITLKDGYGEMIVSGIAGTGVVSSTYDGDGVYPVYAYVKEGGGVAQLEIIFST